MGGVVGSVRSVHVAASGGIRRSDLVCVVVGGVLPCVPGTLLGGNHLRDGSLGNRRLVAGVCASTEQVGHVFSSVVGAAVELDVFVLNPFVVHSGGGGSGLQTEIKRLRGRNRRQNRRDLGTCDRNGNGHRLGSGSAVGGGNSGRSCGVCGCGCVRSGGGGGFLGLVSLRFSHTSEGRLDFGVATLFIALHVCVHVPLKVAQVINAKLVAQAALLGRLGFGCRLGALDALDALGWLERLRVLGAHALDAGGLCRGRLNALCCAADGGLSGRERTS